MVAVLYHNCKMLESLGQTAGRKTEKTEVPQNPEKLVTITRHFCHYHRLGTQGSNLPEPFTVSLANFSKISADPEALRPKKIRIVEKVYNTLTWYNHAVGVYFSCGNWRIQGTRHGMPLSLSPEAGTQMLG